MDASDFNIDVWCFIENDATNFRMCDKQDATDFSDWSISLISRWTISIGVSLHRQRTFLRFALAELVDKVDKMWMRFCVCGGRGEGLEGDVRPVKIISFILSRIIFKVGENGRSPRKTTWLPASRIWLVSRDPSRARTQWDYERFRALKISVRNHSATGAPNTYFDRRLMLCIVPLIIVHIKVLGNIVENSIKL